MRPAAWLLIVGLCAAAVQAEEPYWVEPMRQVHADYTGTGGTISRFGDSISVSMAYFTQYQWTHANTTPADDEALSWIRGYLTSACWHWQDDGVYPFHGCEGGTTSYWPLSIKSGSERWVDYWLTNDNPEMAVIMWGTNDCHNGTPVNTYKENLRAVVQACKDNGTIPVITTIPPRRGYTPGLTDSYADSVRDLAVEEQIPLIEYNAEIHTRRPGTTWDGTLISGDGIHPSNTAPMCDWSETMLATNGYSLRNWVTLHKCYEVWGGVIDAPPWEPFDIKCEIAYVGDGLYGYTFTVDGRDGFLASYFANVSFEGAGDGQIQQMKKGMGVLDDVDAECEADAWDGVGDPPYQKARDSWFGAPFACLPGQVVNLAQSEDYYHIEAGTGGASQYEDAKLAYIACSGDVQYYGVISRRAKNYNISGVITAPVPGDATLDGWVDGADYTLWADNYQATGLGWGEGNFNGDDIVDGADYTIWADHYTGGGIVPEPAGLALIALGSAGLLRARRRRP